MVQPDLVFVSNDRLHLVTETSIQGAPDLVIEVLSPSTARLDRDRKKDAYARFGVREYWIADPDTRTLETYRLEDQSFRLTSTSEATVPSSALFPDLTFDLQSLLVCSPFHETDSARSNWLRSLRYCNGDLNPSAEWGAAAL